MICRPDTITRSGLIAALAALALGCSQPGDRLPPMQQVEQAIALGDGTMAEAQLRAMLDDGEPPETLAAYFGQAAMLQDDLPKARKWLGKGDFSDETAALGLQLLGQLELHEGNLAEAGKAFDRALAVNPQNAALWADIGRLRFRSGEQLQAIAAAERALTIDKSDPAALLLRAQIVRDTYGPLPALDWFAAAAENGANDPAILTNYAATLGEVGDANAALDVLDGVATRWPDAPRVSYLRAVIAARGARADEARALLQRADQTEQNTPAGVLLGGILDMEQGHYASAAQAFDRLITLQPDNVHARHLLARALTLSGGERELVARFAGEASGRHASVYLRVSVARALEALDRREEAAALLDAAAKPAGLTIQPLPSRAPEEAIMVSRLETGAALRDFVRVMLRPGETGAAVQAAARYARRFPGSGDAARLLGDAQLADSRFDAAIASYTKAARVRLDWPLARRLMAAYLAKDDAAGMQAVLSQFLASGTRNAPAAAFAGSILARQGKTADAAQMLDAAIAHGSARDPAVLALRSEVAMAMGQTDAAHRFAMRAYRIQPAFAPAIRARIATMPPGPARQRLESKLQRISAS